jgi:hypothetical protein
MNRGIRRPDEVYQALIEAQEGLEPEAAEAFRARLILLLADAVGDDETVLAAIAAAAKEPGRPG